MAVNQQPNKDNKGRRRGRIAILLGVMAVGLTWYYQVASISNADRRAARRLDQKNKQAFAPPAATPASPGAPVDETPTTAMSPHADLSQPSIKNAQALIDSGLINEGSAMLEKLIEQDPTDTQALMEMAMVFTLDLKDPQKARQILERILDVNPQHRAALNELELLYRELDAVDDGLALLELKSQQYPDSLEIQYVYGRMLSSTDPAAAIPWLQRATFIADQKEQALDQLASAALRAGQISLAINSWTEALTLAENELERAKASGESGLDYLEDKIAATKTELARAKEQLRGSPTSVKQ